MRPVLSIVLLPILCAVSLVDAKRKLKVLVYSPSVGFSHMQFQGRLADLLVEAGHEVHVFIPEQNPFLGGVNGTKKAQRIIRLPLPRAQDALLSMDFMANPFSGVQNMLLDGSMERFTDVLKGECQDILDASHLIDHLRNEHYDVALAEAWDPCSFGLFHAINIPTTLGTMAIPLDNNLAKTLGIPHPPSFNPILCAASIHGDTMPYLDRAWNFFLRSYNSWILAPRVHKVINGVFQDRFGPSFPDIEKIAENMSLAFVNANEFFDLSKPISHKVINIGGIVEKKPKHLTTEMEEIFSESKNGVVLFSFGSIADTTKMTDEMKHAFLNAFAHFPDVTFVWKLQTVGNDSQLLDRYPNVHVVDWVDQVSILAHPKTRAFITHCGMNSLNEASSHGVPLLAIPLFGDQLYNAAIVLKKQMGVYLDIREITEDSVHRALDKVLNDPSYRDHAQLVKSKLEMAPFKAAEKFVKWTEFAAEFSDLSELGLSGAGMNFFVYHSLDVIIPLSVSVILVVVAGYLTVSAAIRRIWDFVALKKKLE